MKTCSKCKETKSLDQFSKRSNTISGKQSICKLCSKLDSKNRRPVNVDNNRNSHLVRTYGISIEQYNQLFVDQNGVCAICGGTDIKKLSVDHNHITGQIRGLLCQACNAGIGFLKDDINILVSAVEYLMDS